MLSLPAEAVAGFCAAGAHEKQRSLLTKGKLILWFWLTVTNLVQMKVKNMGCFFFWLCQGPFPSLLVLFNCLVF